DRPWGRRATPKLRAPGLMEKDPRAGRLKMLHSENQCEGRFGLPVLPIHGIQLLARGWFCRPTARSQAPSCSFQEMFPGRQGLQEAAAPAANGSRTFPGWKRCDEISLQFLWPALDIRARKNAATDRPTAFDLGLDPHI